MAHLGPLPESDSGLKLLKKFNLKIRNDWKK